jgi:hypothetical protein
MSGRAFQIAFFTGQADARTCALSPVQQAFGQALARATNANLVEQNFPYWPSTPPWRPRPLWRASLGVGCQLLGARRASFARRHQATVRAVLARAEETLFLLGSCGLELLRRLELPPSAWARISFVAYGAVARSRPACPGLVVLGRRDWIARGRGPASDRQVDCDHLSYLQNADFAAICREFAHQRLRRSSTVAGRSVADGTSPDELPTPASTSA